MQGMQGLVRGTHVKVEPQCLQAKFFPMRGSLARALLAGDDPCASSCLAWTGRMSLGLLDCERRTHISVCSTGSPQIEHACASQLRWAQEAGMEWKMWCQADEQRPFWGDG